MWWAAAASAATTTIHVPADQPDLVQAVFVAGPGDEIVLDSGLWDANDLLVDKALTIRGQGTASTTIVATGTNDVLQLAAPGIVTIAALTIDGKSMARPVHVGNAAIAHLEGVVVSAGEAPDGYGGNVLVDAGGALELVDSEVAGGHGTYGGGVYFTGGAPLATLTDTRFRDNSADLDGGAIYANDIVWATRAWFCNNDAGSAGGAIYTDTAPPLVVNGTFLGNTSAHEGAAIRVFNSSGSVFHGTFVDNVSGDETGAIGFSSSNDVDIVFVADSVFDRGSPNAIDGRSAAFVLVSYTGFWNVQPWRPLSYNVVEQAPYAEGLDDPFPALDPASCPEFAIPAFDGELVGAADPAGEDNPDGSPPDLGATGGPDADPDLWADTDYDYVAAMWDCNPTDGDVYPGAAELPDGLDNDCDGDVDEGLATTTPTGSTGTTSDTTTEPTNTSSPDPCAAPRIDADADGWFAPRPDCADGRVDCDDADPDVHPGATEIANDGVDQNCDSKVVQAAVGGGACGCATPAPAGAGLAGFAAVIAGLRRRAGGTGRSTSPGLRGALGGRP